VTPKVPTRIDLPLPQSTYLQDHRWGNRPVLPAVEAMEILAGAVESEDAAIDLSVIREARFDKFLPLDPKGEIELWAELAAEGDNEVSAALKSKQRGKRGIARTLTHAGMRFGGCDVDSFSADETADTGIGKTAAGFVPPPSERIYTDLVPFGPSYRNIKAVTEIGTAGIRALLRAPAPGGRCRLGSPFVLDAAFHAACVWGQHYAGVVAFPVGLGERRIYVPCEAGCLYEGRIRVREQSLQRLVFDIDITDRGRGKGLGKGRLREAVRGVVMRDVSGGRLKPPDWLTAAGSGAEA
jgi:hypothetical protein